MQCIMTETGQDNENQWKSPSAPKIQPVSMEEQIQQINLERQNQQVQCLWQLNQCLTDTKEQYENQEQNTYKRKHSELFKSNGTSKGQIEISISDPKRRLRKIVHL